MLIPLHLDDLKENTSITQNLRLQMSGRVRDDYVARSRTRSARSALICGVGKWQPSSHIPGQPDQTAAGN